MFRRLLVGTLMVLVFAWGELEVTPEHPFYVAHGQALSARDITGLHAARNRRDAGAWIKAGDLQAGDRIESQRGSQEVLAVRTRQTREWVYNFEVAGLHTYSVGSHGLVVHNQCPAGDAAGKAADAAKNAGKRGKAPEFPGGKVSESKFLKHVEEYLGEGYTAAGNGRYVSKDGTRQVRYGAHETKTGGTHHGHFESYDKPGGKVDETTTVEIVPD